MSVFKHILWLSHITLPDAGLIFCGASLVPRCSFSPTSHFRPSYFLPPSSSRSPSLSLPLSLVTGRFALILIFCYKQLINHIKMSKGNIGELKRQTIKRSNMSLAALSALLSNLFQEPAKFIKTLECCMWLPVFQR